MKSQNIKKYQQKDVNLMFKTDKKTRNYINKVYYRLSIYISSDYIVRQTIIHFIIASTTMNNNLFLDKKLYYFFNTWQNAQQKLRKLNMRKWVIVDFGEQIETKCNRISILVL